MPIIEMPVEVIEPRPTSGARKVMECISRHNFNTIYWWLGKKWVRIGLSNESNEDAEH